jgi:hypothetical protein
MGEKESGGDGVGDGDGLLGLAVGAAVEPPWDVHAVSAVTTTASVARTRAGGIPRSWRLRCHDVGVAEPTMARIDHSIRAIILVVAPTGFEPALPP